MDGESDVLFQELRSLCKGAGARGPSVLARMGPRTVRECGCTDWDTHPIARRKLNVWVDFVARDYTPERKMILHVALGLHPEACHATLGRREEWLAGKLHCGLRTVQRWVEDALRQFAYDGVAVGRATAAAAHQGYVVRRLEAELRLDGGFPAATEQHRIETTQSLDVIVRPLSLPHGVEPGRDFQCVVKGGRLLGIERQPGELDLISARIALPRPLERGERYSYEIKYEFRPGLSIAPLYVVLPFTPYDEATLTVGFAMDRLPAKVWRFNGVSPWQLEHPDMAGELLPVDPSGRYQGSFLEFCSSRAYGFGWAWA